jgi:threonine aldolase
MTTAEFSQRLAEKSVLANGINPELMRFVTHLDVDRAACEHAVRVIEEICA